MMNIDQNRSGSLEQTREIPVTSVLFFLFFFWFFYCRYGNFLFMAQNYDLFLWDSSFIFNYCRTIAGPLRCFSSFVLQFFYYPLIGAFFLAAALVLLQRMMKNVFCLTESAEFFSWLPCCLLALLVTRMKYYFFDWVDTAFLFSITYGLFAALLIVTVFLKISPPKNRALFLSCISLLTWPLLGFFTLEAVSICILLELGNREKKNPLLSVILPLTTALITPILWFPLYSQQVPFSRIWLSGLLEESAVDKDPVTFHSFYFILAVTIFLPLLLAIFRIFFPKGAKTFSKAPPLSDTSLRSASKSISKLRARSKNENLQSTRKKYKTLEKEKKSSQQKNSPSFPKPIAENTANNKKFELNTANETMKNRWKQYTVNFKSIIILFFLCVLTTVFSYYSPNYKMLLQLGPALEQEDWNRVLKISDSAADPSDPLLMFRLLALDKKNLLAEQIFEKAPIINEIPDLMITLADGFYGDRLLYHFGQVNHAARTAMNNWTIRRERSAWDLETLALCAVTNREPDLANRYLTLLEKTLFHRSHVRPLRDFLQIEKESLPKESLPKEKISQVSPADNQFDSKSAPFQTLANTIRTIRTEIPPRDSFGPFVHPDSILFYEMMTQDFSNSSEKLKNRQLAFLLLLKRGNLFLEKCAHYAQKSENAERIRLPHALQEGLLYYLKFQANTGSLISNNKLSLLEKTKTQEKSPKPQTTQDEADFRKSIHAEDFSFDPEIEKKFEKFCVLIDRLESKGTASPPLTADESSLIIDEMTDSFSGTFWFYERFLPSVEPYWQKQIETQKKAGTVNAPGEAH